jgi:hypothetical protein
VDNGRPAVARDADHPDLSAPYRDGPTDAP